MQGYKRCQTTDSENTCCVMQAAWLKMHGRMCENRISDPSNESLPGPADRAERAYSFVIMDNHDRDHDFDGINASTQVRS